MSWKGLFQNKTNRTTNTQHLSLDIVLHLVFCSKLKRENTSLKIQKRIRFSFGFYCNNHRLPPKLCFTCVILQTKISRKAELDALFTQPPALSQPLNITYQRKATSPFSSDIHTPTYPLSSILTLCQCFLSSFSLLHSLCFPLILTIVIT